MKVITRDELDDHFNSPKQRESQAQIAKIRRECVETQAQREARLTADHDFDDCEFAKDGDCWICDTYGYDRAEDIQLQEAKDGRGA